MQELKLFKLLNFSIHLYCSHVAHLPIFLHNITEISTTSLAINFVFIGSNNFKFSTDINLMNRYYRPYQNLGHIDFNLHNHVFDDIICKPPILK